MRFWATVLLLATALAAACSDGGHTHAVGRPTLGLVWANAQRGYGEVAPHYISNGGDGTGVVRDIKWETWGHDIAIGNGTGYYSTESPAAAGPAPAVVIAFDLGDCDGQLAYRKVRWFFPAKGDPINLSDDVDDYDLCERYVVQTDVGR
ncbi:MAG: hypothetical protein JWN67_4883 [Actinomycetia bacterium]|nr:hypothetical protein [Actinomycetes bacterium]